MRKSIRVARLLQLFGAAFLVAMVVSCSSIGDTNTGIYGLIGLVMVIAGKVYEWLVKE